MTTIRILRTIPCIVNKNHFDTHYVFGEEERFVCSGAKYTPVRNIWHAQNRNLNLICERLGLLRSAVTFTFDNPLELMPGESNGDEPKMDVYTVHVDMCGYPMRVNAEMVSLEQALKCATELSIETDGLPIYIEKNGTSFATIDTQGRLEF